MTINPTKVTISESSKVLKLIGCVFYGDPFHSEGAWDTQNEIGHTWKRFMKLFEKRKRDMEPNLRNKSISYEIHIEPESYQDDKKFYVFVGMEVKDLKNIPLEMFGMTLPETRYAIFTFSGEQMFKGGNYVWEEWLPESKYIESHPFFIQAYDSDRFKDMKDPKSELDWMIPIKERR